MPNGAGSFDSRGSGVGDPVLFWTLFAVVAVNMIVVAFAIANVR